MARILAVWLLAMACASAADHPSFTVDQFIAVAMEYQGPRDLVGADTYGPTTKEFDCSKGEQAAVAQSGDLIPAGHTMVTTCLHVKFGGPLPRGAALAVPETGQPYEYLTVGVEYTASGRFVGAQALHAASDVKTCMAEAKDLLKSNYADGSIPAGNSLLLYCMPVPTIQNDKDDKGGVV